MKNIITDFKIEPLTKPKFIYTSLARYRQNGEAKSWEILTSHDSVAILIYNVDIDSFILVKQFRPAVYINNNIGMSIELCAGIVDKDMSLKQIAQEEIEEECGYSIDIDSIEKITSFFSSVGFAGSRQTIYYAEVNNSMKSSEGGGVDGELIEVIEVKVDDAKLFMFQEDIVKTSGLLFAFMWWFNR